MHFLIICVKLCLIIVVAESTDATYVVTDTFSDYNKQWNFSETIVKTFISLYVLPSSVAETACIV